MIIIVIGRYGHQRPLSLSTPTPHSPTRGASVVSSNLMEGCGINFGGKLGRPAKKLKKVPLDQVPDPIREKV